jgi:hydrogenase maturation protein HypF
MLLRRRPAVIDARRIHVTGIVQGVGFRPFVFRLARAHDIAGWVYNGETGVEIHAEGADEAVRAFVDAIATNAPPAARIAHLDETAARVEGHRVFRIRESEKRGVPTAHVSPDLPVCQACLAELFDPADRRFRYPYINCTDCGPRFSVIEALPYDRARTTMRHWPMCDACAAEYEDPLNRRFHAEPIACPACGPTYVLCTQCHPELVEGRPRPAEPVEARGIDAIEKAAALLRAGAIVAIKGIGGYHLACDATNARAVRALRERKYRKERPFALMIRDRAVAARIVELTPEVETLLTSLGRPIVLASARAILDEVAPENDELGVMLPYTPLHHLLFAAGAPETLVMTSANRSSEPIAYNDGEALERLAGIADAFLVGEREIARRIDDSVARAGAIGPVVLRRARGYTPEAVATLPARRPIVALGADLKNAIAVVVDGRVFVSQHVGDLEYEDARRAFEQTVADLCAMYEIAPERALIAHDAHPEYASSAFAASLGGETLAIQHHRAHVASVLAEREAWEEPVVGVAFDGTGYGDDGTIWGGEFFCGSLTEGLRRAGHLRQARLPGGDAAARFPVQAAAGYLAELDLDVDLTAAPFRFPAERYERSVELLRKDVRCHATTSAGRLFDTVAALLGFTREATFEGQAPMWVEHRARACSARTAYPFPLVDGELDFRPLLAAIIADRRRGRDVAEIAFAFHAALADAIVRACEELESYRIVVSGGVFQNALLVQLLVDRLGERVWSNRRAPPNDGGISVGQAAIAAL